jgi:ABC-2 type transport system ATP-binding protein
MADAVEASGLGKKFGDVTALENISFAVPEGKLIGLIGADGAGKSTLMRILVTLIRPDSGGARVLGRDAAAEFAAIRALIGYMPQKFSLYGDLSVRENLLFFADVFGVPGAERARRMEQLLQFSRLDDFQNRRAANLSGGMKQKLALSCSLIHTPRLLFLDEPTTGVDPLSRQEFWRILFDLKKQGITIVVSTPYMDEAVDCDLLLLLHRGKILRHGSPADLLAGYPLVIYKVISEPGAAGMPPAGAPLPPGVSLMYQAAGELRLAGADPGDPETLLARIRNLLPGAEAIERVDPTIEDLLFSALAEKGSA